MNRLMNKFDLRRNRSPESSGAGPLLQRDYWAVIRDSRLRPSELIRMVADHFADFAPGEYALFEPVDNDAGPLEVGDELRVKIRMAGTFRVRVLHRDRSSFTLGTLKGHPEAGRVTFGAYRNDYGDVIFHIRSRARSGSNRDVVGFFVLGEALQTNTWTDFVNRTAATAGMGVIGYVHAETRKLRNLPEDARSPASPTFIARGD